MEDKRISLAIVAFTSALTATSHSVAREFTVLYISRDAFATYYLPSRLASPI